MRERRKLPSVECLNSRVIYLLETGDFLWKAREVRRQQDRGWNKRRAGKPAGSISVWGYRIIEIDRVEFHASRIAWKLVTGCEPPPIIDHINGNALDNRFCNLREATNAENGANCLARKRSKTGYVGITPYRDGRYQVSITSKGKGYFGGYYADLGEAMEARRVLATKLHGRFAGHLNRQS
jgi:hypothetical protein